MFHRGQITANNANQAQYTHDDVIKWKHFSRYWPFVRGIRRSPVNSPHKVKRGFDLSLNKWLSKQPRHWWLETPSFSLWHYSNDMMEYTVPAGVVYRWTPWARHRSVARTKTSPAHHCCGSPFCRSKSWGKGHGPVTSRGTYGKLICALGIIRRYLTIMY